MTALTMVPESQDEIDAMRRLLAAADAYFAGHFDPTGPPAIWELRSAARDALNARTRRLTYQVNPYRTTSTSAPETAA